MIFIIPVTRPFTLLNGEMDGMTRELPKGYSIALEDKRYVILEVLGKGANIIAYLATCDHQGMTSKCILKQYQGNDIEGFIASVRMQNEIRQISSVANSIPPIIHILKTEVGVFVETAYYNGTTLDKCRDLSLLQNMEICLAIARVIRQHHKAGYLCLDLKPNNIFILKNGEEEVITQIVQFIDFDAVRKDKTAMPYSYSRNWASPELRNVYAINRVSASTDIYAIGEIVFYLLFGRHSRDDEHRGFSKYPFDSCGQGDSILSKDLMDLFTQLFRGTLRSSTSNRLDIDTVVGLLEDIVAECSRNISE